MSKLQLLKAIHLIQGVGEKNLQPGRTFKAKDKEQEDYLIKVGAAVPTSAKPEVKDEDEITTNVDGDKLYGELTVAELKALSVDRGLNTTGAKTKAHFTALLEADDAGEGTETETGTDGETDGEDDDGLV